MSSINDTADQEVIALWAVLTRRGELNDACGHPCWAMRSFTWAHEPYPAIKTAQREIGNACAGRTLKRAFEQLEWLSAMHARLNWLPGNGHRRWA